ncbi:nitronate monooxygenase [Flavobacterium sufflavum]|uniref:Propionate 3-nitronate monooxygenase n=1 Tax=Flavobacterium sufflavum TaxID=1921138 RepID=A0A3S2WDR7_9FLAO|nr:nitronate monooxygenase family protein [Flavobacterium sufflavum]RVT76516.1 nitronate monooxygenase [Flavobacterium sufflavum]
MSTILLNKLGISYPIIQAPMFGVTTPEMVAAANRAGCLGSAALGDLDYNSTIQILRECKNLTAANFAANIFVNEIPPITEELKIKYSKTKDYLYQLAEKLYLEVDLPEIEKIKPAGYQQQIEAIIDENIKILSFTFGNLDNDSINTLKNHGIVLIGNCTSEKEAQLLINSGIDIISLQGIEAGGHRGSFSTENIPKIGGLSLLQNVRAITDIPLIYAGGITSKKTMESLSVLGADGFQIGTLLLCSKESALTSAEKQRLLKASEKEIILTRSFSGRYARGLKNEFIELFENSDYVLPYPYQNKLTAPFRKAARNAQLLEYVNLWTGQSYKNLSQESTESIINNLK